MAPRIQPDPKRPASAHARAVALWGERKYDEAIRAFQEAVRESPNDTTVLIDAARALGARYQIDGSTALLTRALRLGRRRADVQHAVGESYQKLGRLDEAEACFRRACSLAATPASQLALANLCERRHALDEAAELVARVLQAEPRSAAALVLRGRIERRRGEPDKACATLREVTAATDLPHYAVAEAYGELSVVLDAAAEYDQAWSSILDCKKILLEHEQAAWNAAQFVIARCRQMIETLTPEHFERWHHQQTPRPNERLAVLTGFPRSGTTLLEQVLAAHPAVVETEERDIFATGVFPTLGARRSADTPILELLDELSSQQIGGAQRLYLESVESILGEAIGDRVHVDKNPALTLMIPPLKRLFPELKLIIALRDPRDVVLSCFLRYLPINPVSVCFLTLERTVDRYILDMTAWLKMREMVDDWLEVRYEDVVSDLKRETKRTLDALQLPWDESVLQYRQRHDRKQVRSPSYEEVSRPVFTTSIGRWQNYQRQLAPLIDRLAPLIAAFGYEK
jgi:lipopolysaccharide biosynthesis regulator YciM